MASGSTGPERSRIILSTRTKKAIKEVIGACEFCGAQCPPEDLEVYQIGMLSTIRPDENPAHAVIVLCREHHARAKEGAIRKTSLKSKAEKRSDKKKKAMRALLQKIDRTYNGSNVDRYQNPAIFGVGGFMKGKNGSR